MNFKNYFKELQRRHVVKAGLAYLVFTWLVTQVLSILIPVFEMQPSILKTAITVMAIGFPIWLIFAWVYDFTPDGLKKTDDVTFDTELHARKNVKLNRFIIAGLSVAIILLVVNQVRMKGEMTEIKSTFVDSKYKSSIAVMAFADMSPKKDHEYFSDGISEELLNLLAKLKDLRVISRTSSFSYKGKDATAEVIGKELKVSHILEGSIRKDDNTVRITAQLINTNDGSHIWSETYDRDLNNILKVQDEIAKMVSDKLQLTLLGETKEIKKVNPEAYTLYLRAKHLTIQNTKEAYIKAEEIIKHSIALDSTYAPAWSTLSGIYNTGSYNFLINPTAIGLDLGIKAAERSIELDPDNPGAYTELASLQYLTWDFKASQENMNKALKLDPGNSTIIGTAALRSLGNIEGSIELVNKAISLNPVGYINYYNLGYYNYLLGNLDEADKAIDEFSTYYPNSSIYHYIKAQILIARGKPKEALVEAKKESNAFFNLYARNFALWALDRKEEANVVLQELINTYGATEAANMADIHAFRGEVDKAFYWLDKAIKLRDPVLLDALNYPSFKGLHKDPRWNEIISKIGLPEDHQYPVH